MNNYMKQFHEIQYLAVGDSAITVEFGNTIHPSLNAKVVSLFTTLQEKKMEGVTDLIPTFRSLFISYDPRIILFEELKEHVSKLAKITSLQKMKKKKVIEIPVCYGNSFGPDIQNVMEHSGLSQEEVIQLHTKPNYLIYMLGFLPGFAYLGNLDSRLVTPRLSSPRIKINAGSVGIGGSQTGIYPLDSPGGWQIIGRTPLKPFDATRENSILYKAGDYIRFQSITPDEYHETEEQIKNKKYNYKITLEENTSGE